MGRRLILIALSASLLAKSVVSLGQCQSQPGCSVWNSTTGYQICTYSNPGIDILTKFWVVGAGSSNNSGSQSTATMISGNGQVSGHVFPFTTWSGGTSFALPHPAPQGTSCDRTAFLYSVANSGKAQFLIMSIYGDGTNFNFDAITNGPSNILSPVTIPQMAITNSVKTSDGGYDISLSWSSLANLTGGLFGYYDSQPASNVVTGAAVYYWTNTSGTTPPTNYAVGAWTLASGGPNSQTGYISWGNSTPADPTALTVHIPGPIPSNNATYLGMRVLFDNWNPSMTSFFATATDFVGQASAQVGPTPAGVFAGFDAKLAMGTVTATWRSNAESGLAFYQVYASKLVGGPYVPINGTLTSPMGDSHVYTASFPFPKEIGKRKVFLKVKATDMDGTEWWTQPVKVARRTAP